jgi:hypothetical protein
MATKTSAIRSVTTNPNGIEAEIERHRAQAEAELGEPVDRLTTEVAFSITVMTVWTLKPPPLAPEAE